MRRSRSPGAAAPGADLTLAGDAGATRRRHDHHGLAADRRQRPRPRARGDRAHRSASRPRAPSRSRACSVDGGAGGAGASLDIAATATGVVIIDSTFLHCSSPFCIRTLVARRRDPAQHVRRPRRQRRGARLRRRRDPRQPHGSRPAARRGQPQRLHPDRRGRPVDDRRQLVRRAHGWRGLDLARSDQRRADPRRRDREQRRHRPLRGAVRRHLRGR